MRLSPQGPYTATVAEEGRRIVAVCAMDIDGGTFHRATMLCGNNAQTNDSVVAGCNYWWRMYVGHFSPPLRLSAAPADLSPPLVLL